MEEKLSTVTRAAWEAAALRLLDDVYAFAATGPRTHGDWQGDVLAVMSREADDPRGWRTLDWDRGRVRHERGVAEGAVFPFLALSEATLSQKLHPVDLETAARLLVIMSYEWGPIGPWDEAGDALADAWTVLGRFGSDVHCHSNIAAARVSVSPDLTAGVDSWTPLTDYVGDFGFVVVAPEEVGVFWSFDPT
ncbi:hypothetical protein [Streptomyces sp. bgisy159]|uniref:hypothetical protein n=1 Tax=Streptomyces sp. bgisy159 TaxID=3413795 RepID=UPI003F4A09AC